MALFFSLFISAPQSCQRGHLYYLPHIICLGCWFHQLPFLIPYLHREFCNKHSLLATQNSFLVSFSFITPFICVWWGSTLPQAQSLGSSELSLVFTLKLRRDVTEVGWNGARCIQLADFNQEEIMTLFIFFSRVMHLTVVNLRELVSIWMSPSENKANTEVHMDPKMRESSGMASLYILGPSVLGAGHPASFCYLRQCIFFLILV